MGTKVKRIKMRTTKIVIGLIASVAAQEFDLAEKLQTFDYKRCVEKNTSRSTCNAVRDYLSRDCYRRPDPGPCPGRRSLYAYDSQTDSCKMFRYGGCRGNRNQFLRESECVRKCSLDLEQLVQAGIIKRGERRTVILQRKSHEDKMQSSGTARSFGSITDGWSAINSEGIENDGVQDDIEDEFGERVTESGCYDRLSQLNSMIANLFC